MCRYIYGLAMLFWKLASYRKSPSYKVLSKSSPFCWEYNLLMFLIGLTSKYNPLIWIEGCPFRFQKRSLLTNHMFPVLNSVSILDLNGKFQYWYIIVSNLIVISSPPNIMSLANKHWPCIFYIFAFGVIESS